MEQGHFIRVLKTGKHFFAQQKGLPS